jgi:proteasome lid subunit RPN8/RPN11
MQEQTQTTQQATLLLSWQAQQTICDDVLHRPHIEACGLLLGTITRNGDWQAERALPLRNSATSPVYFEFEPEELLTAELQYPNQIIGVYHSHPTGYAQASTTDCQNMFHVNQEQQIPWAWLIVCGPFNGAFCRLTQNGLPPSASIAYHHYPAKGLKTLSIHLDSPPS